MIFQKDKFTEQKLSEDINLEQAKNLPVINYIDLEITEDATADEKAFVEQYRIRNEINVVELVQIVAGNKDNTALKQKIDEIKARTNPQPLSKRSKK